MNGWKEKYIELVGCSNPEEMNIEAAHQFKLEHMPTRLFKFRAPNEYAIDNLDNDTVWLNSPSAYNDPFECVEHYDTDMIFNAIARANLEDSISELTKAYPIPDGIIREAKSSNNPLKSLAEYQLVTHEGYSISEAEEVSEVMSSFMSKISLERLAQKNAKMQSDMKICSFSETASEILMWSHYADNHKGFCVEYDVNKWSTGDRRKRFLEPVIYQDKLYDATEHLLAQINTGKFNNLYPIISCATKAKNWGYEEEWRFVLAIGASMPEQNYPMDNTIAVYLGARMQAEYRQKVISICREKGFEIFQSEISLTDYKVDFQKVEL